MANRNNPNQPPQEITEIVVTARRPNRPDPFPFGRDNSAQQQQELINSLLRRDQDAPGEEGSDSREAESDCSASDSRPDSQEQTDSNRRLRNPTGGQIRGQDPPPWGSGVYGASRTNEDGKPIEPHKGVDYVATPGQRVVAVAGGEVTRIGQVYKHTTSYKLVEITTGDYKISHFYVSPGSGIVAGTRVTSGQVIGTQQSLAPKHPGITEHVHVDIKRNGEHIDPTPLIPVPCSD